MTDADRSLLRDAVKAPPECLSIERLSSGSLTEKEREHLDACAHCQAEQALWREFDGAQPSEDEGAAVQWIVADLARRNRRTTQPRPKTLFPWLGSPLRNWAAAMGTVAVVATVGYMAWDREPTVRAPGGSEQNYRTASVEGVSPVGDVAAAPKRLEWAPVAGAVSYDVEVLEVDRTVQWRTSTAPSGVDLPPSIVAMIVPDKTLLWQVRARDRSNNIVADSGMQRFRLRSVPTRN